MTVKLVMLHVQYLSRDSEIGYVARAILITCQLNWHVQYLSRDSGIGTCNTYHVTVELVMLHVQYVSRDSGIGYVARAIFIT